MLIIYFQKIYEIQIVNWVLRKTLWKIQFCKIKFRTHIFCAQINLAKKMANIVHKKKLQKIFAKIFFPKTNWGKLIVVEIFFIADNVVIFFEKKVVITNFMRQVYFCKKFTCKKISKEIKVRKIYVPNFFWQKVFISLTIWPRNCSSTNSRNKFIVEIFFNFINMFTFNKFIFHKSSINSIQIKITTSQ